MISIIALSLAALAPDPVVTGFRVVPVADRTEVVIQVEGIVSATDFALTGPARVVVDLTGTGAIARAEHRIDRGGVRTLRVAPFQPGVVRVVIDLDQSVAYRVERTETAVRVSFPNPAGRFEPWSTGNTPATAPEVTAETPPVPVLPPSVTSARQQLPPIDIMVTEEPLANVLATFADFANRSIIPSMTVKDRLITAEVRNQPWDVALEAILKANNMIATEQESGVLLVQDAASVVQQQQQEPPISRTYTVRYVSADSLLAPVAAMLGTGVGGPGQAGIQAQVVANRTSNQLVVTAGASAHARISSLIQELDVQAQQVNIAATIAFVDRTALEQLGLTYDVKDSRGNQLNSRVSGFADVNGDGVFQPEEATDEDVVLLGGNSIAALANANFPVPSPALQLVSSLVLGRHTLITFLEALQSVTLSDIQAKPVVTVMNHRTAQIQVGQRTPVRVIDAASGGAGTGGFPVATVNFVDTGVILEVTPHVTGNQVLLELHAERSDAVPAASDIGFVFTTQNADTQVLVEDGETTVIGGLTITEKSRVRSGVPLLMDLPILGALFRNTREQENKRDLLIMVTPHIVGN